jgi:hypothetical protein
MYTGIDDTGKNNTHELLGFFCFSNLCFDFFYFLENIPTCKETLF